MNRLLYNKSLNRLTNRLIVRRGPTVYECFERRASIAAGRSSYRHLKCFLVALRTAIRPLAMVAIVMGFTASSRADLVTSLAAYYKFEGGGADSSGQGRPLNIVGGPGFATGLFGQALDLHGNNSQSAQRPINDTAFNFGSGDFTIQTWVNYRSFNGEQTLIEKFFGGGGPAWTLTTFPGQIRFATDVFPGGLINADVTIPTGIWHNMTVRRIGSTFALFFDGANVGTATSSLPIGTTTLPLLIGKRSDTDGRDFSVDGRLDEIAIWTRGLNDSELGTLYNNRLGTQLPTSSVPEPNSWLLLGLGSLATVVFHSRRRKSVAT